MEQVNWDHMSHLSKLNKTQLVHLVLEERRRREDVKSKASFIQTSLRDELVKCKEENEKLTKGLKEMHDQFNNLIGLIKEAQGEEQINKLKELDLLQVDS